MKKVIIVLLTACLLFYASGCSVINHIASVINAPKDFFVDNYGLQITTDNDFYETNTGNFDLQITNGDSYISVYAYKYIDISSDLTPMDVYEMQNEDLFSKRTAVTLVEESKSQTVAQHTVTYELYSAEKDGMKNYYVTYLVDFPNEETFAWVLVTAMPSYIEGNREYLHDIVCSLNAKSN